jgi:PBP1b-binding outer membrane lipoprotein LpoB
MKKILSLIIVASLLLAGCGSAEAPQDDHAGHNHAPGENHDH